MSGSSTCCSAYQYLSTSVPVRWPQVELSSPQLAAAMKKNPANLLYTRNCTTQCASFQGVGYISVGCQELSGTVLHFWPSWQSMASWTFLDCCNPSLSTHSPPPPAIYCKTFETGAKLHNFSGNGNLNTGNKDSIFWEPIVTLVINQVAEVVITVIVAQFISDPSHYLAINRVVLVKFRWPQKCGPKVTRTFESDILSLKLKVLLKYISLVTGTETWGWEVLGWLRKLQNKTESSPGAFYPTMYTVVYFQCPSL